MEEVMGDEPWCVEVKVVKGYRGAVDIWIPKIRLGETLRFINLSIMVDGEGHFLRNHEMHGVTLKQQRAIDHRFNQRCRDQKQRVLRLHYAQTSSWADHIRHAIRACLGFEEGRYIMRSWSKGDWSKNVGGSAKGTTA